ncbi:MAG: VOC family protein [Halobacteriales archaeon]
MSTNTVLHFELPADDRARATDFYTSAFGWTVEEVPVGDDVYLTVDAGGAAGQPETDAAGGINGAIIERDGPLTAPIITVEVDSIDAHLERIEAAGGTVLVPKGEVPDMGFYAYFEDTEGNVVGLWETLAGG